MNSFVIVVIVIIVIVELIVRAICHWSDKNSETTVEEIVDRGNLDPFDPTEIGLGCFVSILPSLPSCSGFRTPTVAYKLSPFPPGFTAYVAMERTRTTFAIFVINGKKIKLNDTRIVRIDCGEQPYYTKTRRRTMRGETTLVNKRYIYTLYVPGIATPDDCEVSDFARMSIMRIGAYHNHKDNHKEKKANRKYYYFKVTAFSAQDNEATLTLLSGKGCQPVPNTESFHLISDSVIASWGVGDVVRLDCANLVWDKISE